MINDINREIYRMNYRMNNEIYWKIREQDGFNPMKYVCKYMEQENCVMMHDLNNKIKEQDGFYPMINDFNAFHLMIYEMEHLLEKDVAILNSLANYTYTHQLLKCKAF